MISKNMYAILSNVPRRPQEGIYSEIWEKSKLEKNIFYQLMSEARYTGYEYINAPLMYKEDSKISLTEKGQAEIELYEQTQENQKIAEQALTVSRRAMWAAIASAIAAVFALLPKDIFYRVGNFIANI